jgi:hypothetical protein
MYARRRLPREVHRKRALVYTLVTPLGLWRLQDTYDVFWIEMCLVSIPYHSQLFSRKRRLAEAIT